MGARREERERAAPRGAVPEAAPRPAAPGRGAGLSAHALARAAGGRGILPGGDVDPGVARAIADRAGRGARLDGAMAAWSDGALGGHSGHVRVHHDATAAQLASAVSARAFTVRNDVFFARGAYRPQTADGRRLIAHELTHVAQQRGAATGGPLRVTEPGDAHERDAEAMTDTLP
jgi:hypothetical protein